MRLVKYLLVLCSFLQLLRIGSAQGLIGYVLTTISRGSSRQSENCGLTTVIPGDIRTAAPWTSVIFRQVNGRWKFHSNGIIMAPHFVAGAQAGLLGLFPSDKNPSKFFIAAGVNTTDFDAHDSFAQYRRVRLIQPLQSSEFALGHGVVFILDSPLDFSTPYVNDICLPKFGTHLPGNFEGLNLPNIPLSHPFSFIQFGFANSQPKYYAGNNSTVEKVVEQPWTLKAWPVKLINHDICKSIAQFYYGWSLEPVCTVRNMNNRFDAQFFEKLKTSNGAKVEKVEDEDLMCQGVGSSNGVLIGGRWFMVGAVSSIPGKLKQRCDKNSVYIIARRKVQFMVDGLKFLIRVYDCGINHFSCPDSRCIPLDQVCNGVPDCTTGDDEHFALCDWKKGASSSANSLTFKSRAPHLKISSELVGLAVRSRTKKCPPLNQTVGAKCIDWQSAAEVNCNSDFHFGREIRMECDRFHQPSKYAWKSLQLFCQLDNSWAGVEGFFCNSKCGYNHEISLGDKLGVYPGFPWTAAIFTSKNLTCGGSLIENQFVLTHAACLPENYEKMLNLLTIFLLPVSSDFERNVESGITQKFRVKKVWLSYLTEDKVNGLALVKLDGVVQSNTKNRPSKTCYLETVGSARLDGLIPRIHGDSLSLLNDALSQSECHPIESGSTNRICTTHFKNNSVDKTILGSGRFTEKQQQYSIQEVAAHVKDGQIAFLEVKSFLGWIIGILERNS